MIILSLGDGGYNDEEDKEETSSEYDNSNDGQNKITWIW